MSSKRFQLNVSHSQIAVFSCGLPEPFNDWSDEHVRQGFAWRKGSVSFQTLEEAGTHEVRVIVVKRFSTIDAHSVRAIVVPFEVAGGNCIEIASISDSITLELREHEYALRFEIGFDANAPWMSFVFASDESPEYRIAKADDGIDASRPLITTAEPARGIG